MTHHIPHPTRNLWQENTPWLPLGTVHIWRLSLPQNSVTAASPSEPHETTEHAVVVSGDPPSETRDRGPVESEPRLSNQPSAQHSGESPPLHSTEQTVSRVLALHRARSPVHWPQWPLGHVFSSMRGALHGNELMTARDKHPRGSKRQDAEQAGVVPYSIESWVMSVLGRYVSERLPEIPAHQEISAEMHQHPFHPLTGSWHLSHVPGLYFSVASSTSLVVCAIARARPIGIDIEDLDAVPESSVQEAILHAEGTLEDQDSFASHSAQDRDMAFMHWWLRKEAFSKARAAAVEHHRASSMTAVTSPTENNPMLGSQVPWSLPTNWHTCMIEPVPGVIGVLVMSTSTAPTVVLYDEKGNI